MVVQYLKRGSTGLVMLSSVFAGGAALGECAAELERIRQETAMNTDVRCLVLSGAEAFAAYEEADASYAELLDQGIPDPLTPAAILAQFMIPTIAAIEKDATGAGLELALACDLRVCSAVSRFKLDHVSRGTLPFDGGLQRLSRTVGRAAALELILLAEDLTASAAGEIGLVHRIAKGGDVLETAIAVANIIGQMAPVAVRYTKEALLKGMDMPLQQALRLEADLYFLLHTTADRTHGITAFRDKKSPEYHGQ
jgi:enoyl-CoA hydratase/carnithine racemase